MRKIDLDSLFASHPYAAEIFDDLGRCGHRTVIVGGVVRDMLRSEFEKGYTFSPGDADIDIATSANIEQVKDCISGFDFIEVGESFGVLIGVAPDGNEYEIAHFRSESDYDGRKPGRVELVDSLEEDVRRRDFTVNGLAATKDGKVYDHVNGIEDLKNKVIRAIGDPFDRFAEDYLRPLRAIRVCCDIDGAIESDTYAAIKKVSDRITSISWERIREELFKILSTHNSSTGMRLCKECGILDEILPEITENEAIPQPEEYHPEGDVLEHSFLALESADRLRYPPLTKLATFLHDVGKARAFHRNNRKHLGGHELIGHRLAGKIGKRLRLSNKEIDRLTWMVGNHMRGSIIYKMRKAKQVKLIRHKQDKNYSLANPVKRFPYFTDLVRTIIADSEASAHKYEGWLPILSRFSSLLPHLQELENLGTAKELIDGNDLLDLGMEEGPEVGKVLNRVHELIYAGKIDDHESAIRAAKNILEVEDAG